MSNQPNHPSFSAASQPVLPNQTPNPSPNPTAAPSSAPASTATGQTYTVKVEYCRFKSCIGADNNSVGQISSDGLCLKVDNFKVKISHQLPGRLVVQYADPTTGQTREFYRVLRDGVFELIAGQKPQAHWSSIEDLKVLYKDRFGITKINRYDPNITYAETSCQHEGPDGRHHFCFAITDGIMRTFLTDDITGNFDPDSPEDMFFYRGEVEYHVRKATWVVVGTASTEADSSLIGKSINITIDNDHPNPYLLALELDKYLQDHDHGNFDDYIGELKDLV